MCHAKCIFADPLQMSHVCHRFWKCYKTLTFCALLTRCPIPCACHAKRQSKNGANMLCFVHFDFEMCFALQRRTLFRHVNFQKRSEHDDLCTFRLGNVLRATTAYTFSTCQLPKAVRGWCPLCILTWKCASRHSGVHFFDISTSKSAPRPSVFNIFDFEVCFAPQRCQLWGVLGAAGHIPQSTTRSIRRGMGANSTHGLPKSSPSSFTSPKRATVGCVRRCRAHSTKHYQKHTARHECQQDTPPQLAKGSFQILSAVTATQTQAGKKHTIILYIYIFIYLKYVLYCIVLSCLVLYCIVFVLYCIVVYWIVLYVCIYVYSHVQETHTFTGTAHQISYQSIISWRLIGLIWVWERFCPGFKRARVTAMRQAPPLTVNSSRLVSDPKLFGSYPSQGI